MSPDRCGYLLCALAQARPLADAVVLANAAATLAVGGRGAQGSIPVRSEVERLLRRARRDAFPTPVRGA